MIMAKRRGSRRRTAVNRCSKPTSCSRFAGRKGQPHDGKFCAKAGPNRCR